MSPRLAGGIKKASSIFRPSASGRLGPRKTTTFFGILDPRACPFRIYRCDLQPRNYHSDYGHSNFFTGEVHHYSSIQTRSFQAAHYIFDILEEIVTIMRCDLREIHSLRCVEPMLVDPFSP